MAAEADSRPSPAVARAQLDRILKRREFRGAQNPGWLDGLSELLERWIGDFLRWIFSGIGGHPRASRVIMWGLAIGLALAFMIWLFRAWMRPPPREALDLKGAPRIPWGSRDWAEKALESSARGDYRDAIRLAYWAGIHRLGELGLWQLDRTRTHREYLRMLPEASSAAAGPPGKAADLEKQVCASPGGGAGDDIRREALTAVTERFEHTWYGRQAASAGDFQFVMTQLEKLGCALPSTPATASS